jgi:hypothetical protein
VDAQPQKKIWDPSRCSPATQSKPSSGSQLAGLFSEGSSSFCAAARPATSGPLVGHLPEGSEVSQTSAPRHARRSESSLPDPFAVDHLLLSRSLCHALSLNSLSLFSDTPPGPLSPITPPRSCSRPGPPVLRAIRRCWRPTIAHPSGAPTSDHQGELLLPAPALPPSSVGRSQIHSPRITSPCSSREGPLCQFLRSLQAQSEEALDSFRPKDEAHFRISGITLAYRGISSVSFEASSGTWE